MPRVYLGIGSNIDAATNLRLAVRELQRRFGQLQLSSVYRSAPLGFDGDDFLNAVVGFDTELPPDEIPPVLDDIHDLAGRPQEQHKLVSRTLDIDFLLYDRLILDRAGVRLPRRDVLLYGFVLRPLAELAPDYVHPQTGRPLAEHWRHFDAEGHPLTGVSIDLHG